MNKLKKYALADLFEMSSGISTTKTQAGHGAPFASFGTVYNNYFLPDELTDLMDTTKKEQETYSLKKGDILITRTSETIDELAMSSVVLKDYPHATYSGFTKRLRPLTEGVAYHKYLGFYLRGDLFRKTVTNNAFMTLRASFNEDIFSFLNIFLPCYEQQVKIGDFLYLIEKKIKVNNFIINELELIAKCVYEYWFTQFNFVSLEGKPYRAAGGIMKDNELLRKKIPYGWSAVKLNSLCEINSGYPFESEKYVKEDKYKIITIKNVQDSGINLKIDNFLKELPEKLPSYCILKSNDILMSLTGNVGRVGLMYADNYLLNQRVANVKPLQEKFRGLIYFLLKSPYMRAKMESISTGTTQKNLSPIDTGELYVAFDEKIFSQYSKFANTILSSILQKHKENQTLSKLRDQLLPLFINGQASIY